MVYRNETGKRLFVNADRTKVVDDETSADAAYLLVGVDGELDDETAKRYGLESGQESRGVTFVAETDEERNARLAREAAAQGKQVSSPPENKAVSAPAPTGNTVNVARATGRPAR